jgi:hypothetical protein
MKSGPSYSGPYGRCVIFLIILRMFSGRTTIFSWLDFDPTDSELFGSMLPSKYGVYEKFINLK